jgi:putative Mg2+ transporter-C (MgtC) family protein
MASLVVSGVGFLGAGVIFKDGASVHGLNTAATIWCSAAIGVLAGLNSLIFAAILTAMVILTNVAFRPLLRLLHLAVPVAETPEVRYEIVITCRTDDETHLRTLLLSAIGRTTASLQAIRRTEDRESDHARLQTEIRTHGRQNELVEEIAARLSIEPSVTSLNWSAASTIM